MYKNPTLDATPYCSGLPIGAIPESDKADDNKVLARCRALYQSLIGCIGWITFSTRPDLAPAHSFLSSYNNKPSPGHTEAALYVLHYIHSTVDYGISFTSEDTAPIHT